MKDEELDGLIPELLLIEDWCKAIRSEIEQRLLNGSTFSRAKMSPKRAIRQWQDTEEAKAVLLKELEEDVVYPRVLLTPSAMEKALGKKSFAKYAEYVVAKSSGDKLTLY